MCVCARTKTVVFVANWVNAFAAHKHKHCGKVSACELGEKLGSFGLKLRYFDGFCGQSVRVCV